MKNKVVIIIGPTASGKTGFAVNLAQEINGEIISADSRQVFRDMDIGSGKDLHEYGEIPYHLINIRNAGEEFSVSDFQIAAHVALKSITSKKKIPIICGGTMYYVKALIDDYSFDFPKTNRQLTEEFEKYDRAVLYNLLRVHGLWDMHHWERDSRRRIARSLEKAIATTQNKDSCLSRSFTELYSHNIYYPLIGRELIKSKIKLRLDQRFEEGLIDEVKHLLSKGVGFNRLARYGLEYKWISMFLNGSLSYEDMYSKLLVEIYRFAKRQMTFIRYLEKQGHHLYPFRSFPEFRDHVTAWLFRD